MTVTMSQSISPTKLAQAAALAKKSNENVAVVATEVNDDPIQMLFPVSVVEASKKNIEVIAIIDKHGNYVD